MRWKTLILGIALVAGAAAGCKQQCFVTEGDYEHYKDMGLRECLETDQNVTVLPSTGAVPAPANILDPDREIRPLTLAEAIAMSLEHGTIGSPALNGTTNTSLVASTGRGVFPPESNIRVLALDPAIAGADIETSLSKFDARWTTTVQWSTIDEPPTTSEQINQNVPLPVNADQATFSTSLLKPLPTGGVAGVTFRTDYTLSKNPFNLINPQYKPSLQFQFEQPLLQGFGVEINELRPTHPGSILTPFNTGGRVEGVLITRIRFDQARAEFERNLHIMLVNTEVAYWNLYGSYWNLYSREQALRLAFEAYRINKERYEAGKANIQDLSQSRAQFELFRGQRVAALNQVLENERALRAFVGLPVSDCTRLVPIDKPTLAPYQPNWCEAVNEALALRPELVLIREELKFRQLDIINAKNLLMPDLRFISTYNVNGLGSHLDGGAGDPNNAFHSLGSDQFHDWTLGLRADIPIGFREAHSSLRQARLNLARTYGNLCDQESKAQQFLVLQYDNVLYGFETIRYNRAAREAFATLLDARFKSFISGGGQQVQVDFLLEAMRTWADSLRDEANAIVQYNVALISFEFAKGTILQHNNVVISEGPLPCCAQVRAVEHERERTAALVLRERASPACGPKPAGVDGHGAPVLPDGPSVSAPSVPSLFEGQPPLPALLDAPGIGKPGSETLPSPRPVTPGVGDSKPQASGVLPTPRPETGLPFALPSTNTPAAPSARLQSPVSAGPATGASFSPPGPSTLTLPPAISQTPGVMATPGLPLPGANVPSPK